MARERWLADGWEITEGVVREWEYRSGTDATSAPVGSNATVPNRDGEIWRPKASGAAGFTLNVWVAGATRVAVEDNWRLLLRAVRRRHRLITMKRYMADGEVLTADVELVGTIDPTHIAQRGMRASLTFNVPSGRWWSDTTYTMQTTPSATLPQTLVLTQFEPSTEAMVDLLYEVKGQITAPTVVDTTDGVDGDSIKYDASVSALQSIKFDALNWNVTSGTSPWVVDQSKVLPTGRHLMTVVAARPGQTPTVQLRGSSASSTCQLIVTGRRSYAC